MKTNLKAAMITLVALVIPLRAGGEFLCHTDVYYQWKRLPKVEASPAPAAEGTPAAPAAGEANPAPEPEKIFWKSLKAKGETEEAAKQQLSYLINHEKVPAMQACRAEHQNLSGCVSAKYQSMGTTIHTLNFSARKALEEAIAADCSSLQGQCLGAISDEAKCAEKAAEAEKEEGGKDGKEGKEKDKGKKK